MSNEMFLGDTRFHMDQGKEEAACLALSQVASQRVGTLNWRAGDIHEMVEARECEVSDLSLDDLVQCWGWLLIRELEHETNEIINIDLREDFSSDEDTLFEILAPYVTAGSFIELEGRDTGGLWNLRYGFTGRRVIRFQPTGYPSIPIED